MGKTAEIYGSSNCYYCAQALRLCKLQGLEVVYHNTDKVVNHLALERRLHKDMKITPYIFVDSVHFEGGYNELQHFFRYR